MLKKVVIIGLSIVGVVVLFLGGFIGWFSYQLRVLNHIETTQINDSLYVIMGDRSNMYLMKTASGFVAFDASDNVEKITEACTSFGIDPQSVSTVFLTHSDADHVNGLTAFPKAKVYLGKDEELLLKQKERHFLGMSMMNKLPVSKYETLNDGDSVTVGDLVIHAISTPGHTIGSMCFRVNEAIFTGDLCLISNGEVQPMVDIFTEDRERDSLSILQISRMDNLKEMYTAHSGYETSIDKVFKAWN